MLGGRRLASAEKSRNSRLPSLLSGAHPVGIVVSSGVALGSARVWFRERCRNRGLPNRRRREGDRSATKVGATAQRPLRPRRPIWQARDVVPAATTNVASNKQPEGFTRRGLRGRR